MARPTLRSSLWIAAATLALSGPASSDPKTTTTTTSSTAQIAMSTNAKCDGVRDLMIDTLVYQMVVGYGYGGYGGYYGGYYPSAAVGTEDMSMTKGAAAPTADSAGGGGGGGGYTAQPSHYTTTNVQEKGVDEGDIVKTDGKFVYTLRNNELVIAKTWPVDKTGVAARVSFKTLYPQQLYLHGDEIVLQGWAQDANNGYAYGSTRVMVINIKDRTAPVLKRVVDVDGYSLSSRIVGDDVYLVQSGQVQLPQPLVELAQKAIAKVPRNDQASLRPWEIQSKLATTLRATLLAKTTQADVEAALPKAKSGGKTYAMACSDMYVPPANMQLGLTSLTKIGLTSKKIDTVGAMLAGGQVYASTDAIYVTAPYYSWTHQGAADYGTQIHKFSLGDDGGRPAYIASGKVDGNILNQFSMSEWNGDLRVATTDWNWNGNSEQHNNLFVMRAKGKSLAVIGSIRGIAKGEQIYAGRMFGDKGYLVTFRQTDPLFTLDLSDPTKPRIAGELKVNGFSSYIHPMGNDLLLTIGQDATDDGRVTGMHLQVFDVSNPAKPTRKFHEKVATASSYSWSAAQSDHKAFTYDPVTGTLAIPLQEYTNSSYYSGLVVYNVDKKHGFEQLGKIDHGDLADPYLQKQCADARAAKNGNEQYLCSKDYLAQMQGQYPIDRSIVVDKYLLTLSSIGLEIHGLKKLDKDAVATLSWIKVDDTKPQIAE